MWLLFVMADIGRPDRFWHLMPPLGVLSFPRSILAWDMIVLNLYFAVNFVVVTHILYRAFWKRAYSKQLVVPLVLLSIPMAIGIHTVTAFLYNGLSARPYWNSSILAPQFLARRSVPARRSSSSRAGSRISKFRTRRCLTAIRSARTPKAAVVH